MPIVFRCVTCGKTLRVGDDAAGKKARCPDCGTIQQVVGGLSNFTAVSDLGTAGRGTSPFTPPNHSPTTFESGNPFSDATLESQSAAQSENPYAAPLHSGGSVPQYSNLSHLQRRELAFHRVKAPAVALMVVQVLILCMLTVQILTVLIKSDIRAPETLFPILSFVLSLGTNGCILFGAWRMYRLHGYGWAIAAAILAMIPCSGCCVVDLPLGIWALIVLNDSIVKSAFH